MSRQIIIIGGGISGLSLLHNLKKRYADDTNTHIRLFEKNAELGGTIHTHREEGTQFEYGPNGFLNSQESTLKLIRELDLEDNLLSASPEAGIRYISIKNRLHALPTNPAAFIKFKPLSITDKFRIVREMFIEKGTNDDETVSEFGNRRLGEKFTNYLLDPMVSGIFAGDAQQLHLSSAFPRIWELEQTYGSLLKAMLSLQKEQKQKNRLTGQPTGQLFSFEEGMGQLVETLGSRYESSIQLNEHVISIQKESDGYIIETNKIKYFADELFICTPAYVAAKLLNPISATLSSLLGKIPYAPIIVVGLEYDQVAFPHVPKGFGYLIPSTENKKVLGVLFSSNVFTKRSKPGKILIRVMIGGARHPEVMNLSKSEIIDMAKNEIINTLQAADPPEKEYFVSWPKGIPQYNRNYPELKTQIIRELAKIPHLHLQANYLDGISLNDCTKNTNLLAEKIKI